MKTTRHFTEDQGYIYCTPRNLKNIILDYGTRKAIRKHKDLCSIKTAQLRFEIQEVILKEMISLVKAIDRISDKQLEG